MPKRKEQNKKPYNFENFYERNQLKLTDARKDFLKLFIDAILNAKKNGVFRDKITFHPDMETLMKKYPYNTNFISNTIRDLKAANLIKTDSNSEGKTIYSLRDDLYQALTSTNDLNATQQTTKVTSPDKSNKSLQTNAYNSAGTDSDSEIEVEENKIDEFTIYASVRPLL